MNTNTIYLMFLLCLTSVYSQNENDTTVPIPVEHRLNDTFNIHDKRIINGHSIDISQAKYYVFVSCGESTCGGTLVRRNKVITAGHCLDSCTVNEFEGTVGLNDLRKFHRTKKVKAIAFVTHPKYDKDNPVPYDVAVVTLSENVELNRKVGTIDYATSIPPVGRHLTVVGYGIVNMKYERPARLQRTYLRIVEIDETKIYTEVQGTSVLPGDSGSPAIYNNRFAGITSAMVIRDNIVIKNIFVAVANPEILSFIRKYAP